MGPLRKSRIEYVDWCVNWRRGCSHGCTYCYAAGMAHRFGNTPEGGWRASELVIEEPGKALWKQLQRKRAPVAGMVLVSSSHDPFAGDAGIEARDVVGRLGDAGLWPQTMILTKSPMRAVCELNGVGVGPEGVLWLGTTVTSLDHDLMRRYEPGNDLGIPESTIMRILGMRQAKRVGYKTWFSLEPPLPGQTLERLVRAVQVALDWQPWMVLGKMNYRAGPDPVLRAWSRADHWGEDRDAAVADLVREGYVESKTPRAGGYWVKSELQDWGRPTGGV